MGVVYIYGTSSKKKPIRPATPAVKEPAKVKKEKLTFEKVCSAIDTLKDLSTLQSVYTAIKNRLTDAKSTKDDIIKIIEQDPVVVTKIIRMLIHLFLTSHVI